MNKYLTKLKSIISNINLPFQVMEDNGGGLYLIIFNEDLEIIYMSTNFEYNQGELTSALIEISDKTQSEVKTIISNWETSYDENSWDIMDEYEKLTQDRVGVFTIVDNLGIYPALMGNAGIIEFKILEEEN